MQIPTFFLRTNMRLLISQALVGWFCIRCRYLPIPSTVRYALTSYGWSHITTAKDILDSRCGFILPWELTIFLPVVLDEYIMNSMPELAILLGNSPCEVAPKDPDTHMCVPDIAYQCQHYADMWAHRNRLASSLEIMEICWEKYHTDVNTARKHHEIGHKHESQTLMMLAGCLQALESWEKKREMCPSIPPIFHCIATYGAQDFVAELQRKNLGLVEEEQTRQEADADGGKETATDEQVEAATS
ncbi:unnamed protein product [Aureobasidium mustum]|uniref:Uncharacterized protein n=1 Tax=Aureobasidium mustum TaxID=2773714 RepID=A0A9N8K0V8_9PEZI|nr:unnamed protein product [Aureobasidium mustum]